MPEQLSEYAAADTTTAFLVNAIELVIENPDYSFHLRVLADIYEERGYHLLASGYRWLAEHKRVPDPQGGWLFGHKRNCPHTLPARAARYFNYTDTVEARKNHKLADSAILRRYYCAALAVGRWLRERKVRRGDA